MSKMIVPAGYRSPLTLVESELALKLVKDTFERRLSESLRLTRVSAPLFVEKSSGLNDDLNGVERAVSFDVPDAQAHNVEIVHSLAKWKRDALKRYGFSLGEGLYTDMNAIRRDEELDNIHSIYVDQWDWELVIKPEERTIEFLKKMVRRIYGILLEVEYIIHKNYPQLGKLTLPEDIHFITSQELLDRYPKWSAKERENAIAKEYGAVFVMQIGDKLTSGERHDGRAPDYDDWQLNGDILVWFPLLEMALELSSMGIRVDANSLKSQLEKANALERINLPYHQNVLHDRLPLTIGGGIGQSRLCMYFLHKAHIGEVQASLWPAEMLEHCKEAGIKLL